MKTTLVASFAALAILIGCAMHPSLGVDGDAPVAPDAAAAALRPEIYDGTLYKHKPSEPLPGLKPFRFVYTGELWAHGADRNEPDVATIMAKAANWPTDRPIAIDIEHWGVGPDQINDTLRKFTIVADAVRRANPNVKFGFYGAFPVRNYWAAQPGKRPGGKDHKAQRESKGEGNTDFDRWNSLNAAFAPIAAKVDYIFPSLYTFYTDQAGWKEYAETNLQQARQYSKPILAVVWPHFHDSNRALHGQPIPGDYWKLQMDTLLAQGVGVVIWSGPEEFDPAFEWWNTTQKAAAGKAATR